jgi:hypothetical protein
MPEWLIPLLSAVGGGLETAFGGRQKQQYKFSPYEQMVLDELMKQYKGEVPAEVTAPYYGLAKDIEQQYARQPGVSGIVSGMKERLAYAPMSRAVGSYKQSLLPAIMSLTRGTGETITQQPKDYSSSLGDIGFLLAMLNKKGVSLSPEEWLSLTSGGGRVGYGGGI